MSASPATDFAVALLGELVRSGVRDLVLCPGSRSQALALAAAEYERLGALRLHVRVDERSAAFLALGIAIESGRPVPVVTTSGTAVANLHPAVLEAWHSGVPLLLLTADRPAELHGVGANQTTVQDGVFGPAVPTTDVPAPVPGSPSAEEVRALVAAAARAGGPVHLNLAFREPLSAAVTIADAPAPGERPARPAPRGEVVDLERAPGTVVVAGARAGEDAERVARELDAPLLAEVSSGARFGPQLVVAYRELLREPGFGDAVRRAIVFGHPTLSREVPALLGRPEVETIVVRAPGAEAYDPARRARVVGGVRVLAPPGAPHDGWSRRWVAASRALVDAPSHAPDLEASRSATPAAQAAYARQVLAGLRRPVDRRALVEAVWAATWPHDRLVLGASRLIREADRVVPGKRIRVHANRGLAGIDGTVSTAAGVALAATAGGARGVTRVLLGDLTLLHDVGGLLLPPGEDAPRLQVVVGNDGGGTIFDSLEVAASADPAAMERVLRTPQRVSFASLAAAYGWEHRAVATASELDEALTAPGTPVLIEVALPR